MLTNKRGGVWMNSISIEEKEYSERILFLRISGDIDKSIDLCDEAIRKFSGNNFFL